MKRSAWFHLGCLLGPRFVVWLAVAYYLVPLLVVIGGVVFLAVTLCP